MLKAEDFLGPPCRCPLCVQADVDVKDQVRDRHTGQWLHGYDLKRWYMARDAFWTRFHEASSTDTQKRGFSRIGR